MAARDPLMVVVSLVAEHGLQGSWPYIVVTPGL